MNADQYELENRILARALKRCADGHETSFKVVYDLTSRRFLAIVTKLINDEETAKDVLQMAYLSIWNNASKYDPEKAKAFTWMLVIIRNRAIDALRFRKRLLFFEDIQGYECREWDTHLEKSADTKKMFAKLSIGLGKLPLQSARVIRLQYFCGFTLAEIANLENVSINTVKSWVRRGLSKLREEMTFTEGEIPVYD